MSSIASTDSPSHDAGPTTFSRALPEMSGNSVSPIRAPQDTPEILAWLNLPYDDDIPMPTSFVTRRRLVVESKPEVDPAQVVITQDEPLGPYRARIENLASRAGSRTGPGLVRSTRMQYRQQQRYRHNRPPNCRPTRICSTKKTL